MCSHRSWSDWGALPGDTVLDCVLTSNGSTVVGEADEVCTDDAASWVHGRPERTNRWGMLFETPFYEIWMVASLLLALAGPWLETLTRGRSPGWLNIVAYVAAVACFMLWGLA